MYKNKQTKLQKRSKNIIYEIKSSNGNLIEAVKYAPTSQKTFDDIEQQVADTYNQIQSKITNNIRKKRQKAQEQHNVNCSKEVRKFTTRKPTNDELVDTETKLTNLITMIHTLQSYLLMYGDSLNDVYAKLLAYGANPEKLGLLKSALDSFKGAQKNFNVADTCLDMVYKYNNNKQMILNAKLDAFTILDNIIPEATHIDFDGSRKCDTKKFVVIGENDFKTLEEWFMTYHKNDKQTLYVL